LPARTERQRRKPWKRQRVRREGEVGNWDLEASDEVRKEVMVRMEMRMGG
jgi:hypothetical protein